MGKVKSAYWDEIMTRQDKERAMRDATYPNAAGYKEQYTSKAAAKMKKTKPKSGKRPPIRNKAELKGKIESLTAPTKAV